LFQKYQIYVFGEASNLFEFENIFQLDLNLGFKAQMCRKEISKQSSFSLAVQASSWPVSFLSFSSSEPAH
jgi:hypothetical protein